MKTKELIFVPTGEVRPPKKGEWILSTDSILNKTEVTFTECKYPIYKAEERVTEWKPEKGYPYFVPIITAMGEAGSDTCHAYYTPRDYTFIFPTPELATAQAQKWIDEAKGEPK